MIIKSIRVQNYRCVLDETLECESLTALVGPNGSGKSSFQRALELFYATSPRISPEDFYREDTTRKIEITVVFTDLEEEARNQFGSYVEGEDLMVVRILSCAQGKIQHSYQGARLSNPGFGSIRSASKVAEARAIYQKLREDPKYSELPAWTNRESALSSLGHWEEGHPGECSRQRDEGQFFGFAEVASGYLGRFTKFIPVPAIRDAATDVEEGRGSPITEIMDLVVRSSLGAHKDLLGLKAETKKRYDEIVDPTKLGDLQTLQDRLTRTLETYVPGASIHLSWVDSGELQIPLPSAEVRLTEDGYLSSVGRTGHGLQRAFILTMLQHLAITRLAAQPAAQGAQDSGPATAETGASPLQSLDLILGIEEPELYQHPNRQRRLASILLQLATGALPAVARKTQVIYSTHSPAFVGIDCFNQIRLFRKVTGPANCPKITKVTKTSLDEVAAQLWEIDGRGGDKYTSQTLLPRLQTLMTPWMNEGFFAEVVLLVEGEEDRAQILGNARSMGYDLEGSGISVIPAGGKHNLDRPTLIFKAFGIPVYVVWDSDQGDEEAEPNVNRRLLRLVGEAEEDYPHKVGDNYACFRTTLADTLREELGAELFDRLLVDLQAEFGITRLKQAMKNPLIVQMLIERARTQGRTSPTLQQIIEKARALRTVNTAVRPEGATANELKA